jgi:hypothetical protein
MQIGSQQVIKILNSNFPFKIVDTPLGNAVEMTAREAFIFSAVTGAGYLDNPLYPFTPKGILKLFYNAFGYKFVTGIFENVSLKNTPFLLSKAKPFLFNSQQKYVLPVSFQSEIELQKKLEAYHNSVKVPEDYLILRIEASKTGNGMEPFMEYLVAEYFRRTGYIVETQIPLAHSLGSPDFAGYGLTETLNSLKEFNFLHGGFHIIELAMLRLGLEVRSIDSDQQSTYIVGEAKTGTKYMSKQLNKYLDTGLFDMGFEIHPAKTEPSEKWHGLFTLDSHLKVKFIPSAEKYSCKATCSREDYSQWLNDYMKFYAIANMTNDELNHFYNDYYKKKITSQVDIITFVCSLKMSDILKFIVALGE